MRYTDGYCEDVPRKSEQSKLTCLGSNTGSDPAMGWFITVGHRDWPEFRFVVGFNGRMDAVSFEVMARPAPRSRSEFLDDALDKPRGRVLRPIPSADGPAVTARLVRTLPVGEIQEFARAQATRTFELPAAKRALARWASGFEERPGRRGRDDRAYAAVAALYVESGHDVHKVAAQLGYSVSTVKGVLYEARQPRRGPLLTQAPRGKAGGELTDKAREILNGDRSP